MKGFTKKQLAVRVIIGIPFLPLQLFLRAVTRLGEWADDIDYTVSKFVMTKVIHPVERKLEEDK